MEDSPEKRARPERPTLREQPGLSVVIPAYNEARRIESTLRRIRDYLEQTGQRGELIVVDDGSQDGTAEVVRQFAREAGNVRLLVNPANRGKGNSVRQGMLAAVGELLLMCDADLSAPIEELGKLLPELERGGDIVIGSRDLPDSRVDPPQPFARRLLARLFRAVRRCILLRGLRDTQCGFKLFRRDVARQVFARGRVNGWLFDCEILAIAQRLGCRIKEVGIVWHNNPDSRVKPWRSAIAALPTLLSIRLRTLRTR